MGHALEKLLSISSPSIESNGAGREPALPDIGQRALVSDVIELLRARNGFFAFESALYVRSIDDNRECLGLASWNAMDGWRREFGESAAGLLFFAEDVFGAQFCVADSGIGVFDPETGEHELLAETLEGWADRLLSDYRVLTGQPLARSWQVANGPLAPETRLVPFRPFVLGGAFSLDNLSAMRCTEGMRFRAGIARQIRGVPDGAKIRLKVVD
jgi:hypothetical protein